MRVKELKVILEKENINSTDYDLFGVGHIKGYDGYVLQRDPSGKYQVIYEERGKKDILGEHQTEQEACMHFLREMSEDFKQLAKYIQ